MMKHKRVRIAIGVLAAFIALTAIGGTINVLDLSVVSAH